MKNICLYFVTISGVYLDVVSFHFAIIRAKMCIIIVPNVDFSLRFTKEFDLVIINLFFKQFDFFFNYVNSDMYLNNSKQIWMYANLKIFVFSN